MASERLEEMRRRSGLLDLPNRRDLMPFSIFLFSNVTLHCTVGDGLCDVVKPKP